MRPERYTMGEVWYIVVLSLLAQVWALWHLLDLIELPLFGWGGVCCACLMAPTVAYATLIHPRLVDIHEDDG